MTILVTIEYATRADGHEMFAIPDWLRGRESPEAQLSFDAERASLRDPGEPGVKWVLGLSGENQERE